MRLFIAIELPDSLKATLEKFIKELQKLDIVDAKFLKSHQLHLTLKFLGEVPEDKVSSIKETLGSVAEETEKFTLQLKGFGHFNYRVLWIGGNSGQKNTAELAEKIDSGLNKLGFPKEPRKYAVHLTLARVRYWKNKEKFKEILEKYSSEEWGSFSVEEIKLIKSTLTGAGPIYEELGSFKF